MHVRKEAGPRITSEDEEKVKNIVNLTTIFEKDGQRTEK